MNDAELFKKIHEGENKIVPQRTIEEKNKPDKNYEEFRESVLIQLASSNKKGEASEEVVKYIRDKYKIYTIRNDEKIEMWIYNKGIYVPHGKTYIKEECREILKEAYTAHFATKIIEKIETNTYVDHDEFFNNNYIDEIAVENGILNIFTRELKEFTPDKLFFNKIPVIYDPSKECKNIQKHFNTILKKGDISSMEEVFGYLLLKENKFEKAFMFMGDGKGRNGKGKTIELMKRFLGIKNCISMSLHQLEEDNWAIAELLNKMANLAGDIEKTALKKTSILSTLTGRDPISASRKFLNKVTFTNYAKMIFCANELPIIYDDGDAFWNRWILFNFPYVFLSEEEYNTKDEDEKKNYRIKNPDIIEQIVNPEEMSGLLNTALDGLDRLMKKKGFSISQTTEEVKEIWLRKSDSFMAFLMDHIEEDYNSRIEKKELKNVYVSFCRKHQLKICSDKVMKIILNTNTAATESRRNISGEKISFWEGIKLKKNNIGGQEGQHGQGILPYTNIQSRSYRVKNYVLPVHPVLFENLSDDIQTFISSLDSNKTDWQTLSAKFGEDRVQKAMDEGLIYEPLPNQIKVLEKKEKIKKSE